MFHQGDEGKSWYIILKGSVNVVIYGKVSTCNREKQILTRTSLEPPLRRRRRALTFPVERAIYERSLILADRLAEKLIVRSDFDVLQSFSDETEV